MSKIMAVAIKLATGQTAHPATSTLICKVLYLITKFFKGASFGRGLALQALALPRSKAVLKHTHSMRWRFGRVPENIRNFFCGACFGSKTDQRSFYRYFSTIGWLR